MMTIFFTGTKLLVLNVLPREEKFNQGHFHAAVALTLCLKDDLGLGRDQSKSVVF
jgi:hypothetical protein